MASGRLTRKRLSSKNQGGVFHGTSNFQRIEPDGEVLPALGLHYTDCWLEPTYSEERIGKNPFRFSCACVARPSGSAIKSLRVPQNIKGYFVRAM